MAIQEPRLLPTPDSPRRLRKILFHNPQIDVPAPAADVPDSGPLWSFTETQEPLPPWEYVDTIIAGSCSIRRYFHGTSFIQSQMLRFFNADGSLMKTVCLSVIRPAQTAALLENEDRDPRFRGQAWRFVDSVERTGGYIALRYAWSPSKPFPRSRGKMSKVYINGKLESTTVAYFFP